MLHHGVFFSPKIFLLFLLSGEAPKDREERGVRLGKTIFYLPGNDHRSLSSQHFFWWSRYFWSWVNWYLYRFYTDLKMEIIYTYYIHVFFSKIVVYRFYDHFGDTTISVNLLQTTSPHHNDISRFNVQRHVPV